MRPAWIYASCPQSSPPRSVSMVVALAGLSPLICDALLQVGHLLFQLREFETALGKALIPASHRFVALLGGTFHNGTGAHDQLLFFFDQRIEGGRFASLRQLLGLLQSASQFGLELERLLGDVHDVS